MPRRRMLPALLMLIPALCSSGWRRAPYRFNQPPVIIDAGHGGQDLGAVVKGYYEKNLNLTVARKLRDILVERWGIPARLTRNTDDFIALDARVNKSRAWDGALFISLHADKVRTKKAKGISIYSFSRLSRRRSTGRTRRKGLPAMPPPSRAQARRGAKLAAALTQALDADKFDVDPPQRQDYYVLKNQDMPSVLVEMGYLSNAREYKLLRDPAYQDSLMETLARGIKEYLEKTSPLHPPPAILSAGNFDRIAAPIFKARPAL